MQRLPLVRLVLALLVAGTLGGALAGCARSQAEEGVTTIRFAYYGVVEEIAFIDELVTRFEAENPDIRIKKEHIAGQAYNSKLMAMTVGRVAPDVMMSDDEYFTEMAVNGLFAPLDEFIARDAEIDRENFYPPFYDTWNWEGVQWAVPVYGHCLVIYYNRELLRNAGLPDPPLDWTWDDFIEYGKKLTVDRNGDGRPDQFGAYWPTWAHSLTWLWSMGGEFIAEDRQHCLLDSPRSIAGYDFQRKQVHEYRICPSATELPGMDINSIFIGGKVGLALHGPWWLDQVKHAPNLDWDLQEPPLAPNPDYPGGHRETRATCEGIAISSASQHQEEAWRWTKFLLSDEAQTRVAETGRAIPAIRAVAEREMPDPKTPQDEAVFLRALEYARPQHLHPRWNEASIVLNREWDLMRIGTRTTEEAMRIAARDINRILQEER